MSISFFRSRQKEALKNHRSKLRHFRRHLSRQLGLEQLEDRRVLATLGQIGGALGDASTAPSVLDAQGNVYLAGRFMGTVDFDPGVGVVERTTDASADGFVAKYTPQGALLWVRQLNIDARINGVTVDATGTPYLYGGFVGTASFGGGYIYTSAGETDPFVAKLDSTNGNTLWARAVLGGPFYEDVNSVSVGADGSVYSSGSFSQQADFDRTQSYTDKRDILTATGWKPKGNPNVNYVDGFVWKLNAAGNFVSAWQVGGTSGDRAGQISVDVDVSGNGFLYLSGDFSGTADFDPGTPQSNRTSAGSSDIFFARYALSGASVTLNWVQSIGSSNSDQGYTMAADSQYLYLAGSFSKMTDFDPSSATRNLVPIGGTDVAIAKYRKSDGGLEWVGQLGGSSVRSNIIVDAGTIYFGGGFTQPAQYVGPSEIPSASLSSAGGSDGFVLKLDSSGTYQNAWRLGGSGSDFARVIGVNGGTVYISGNFEATANFPNGQSLTDLGGGSDSFLLALDQPAPTLLAASLPQAPIEQTLSASQVQPILLEAIARWQAEGMNTSGLGTIQVQLTNLGGTTLGLASGNTITLDDNAAGWGWFVGSTPSDDSDFLHPGNQGEMNRMDLLTVVMHELGHLLGHNHDEDGVMAETLAAGVRSTNTEAEHDAALGTFDEQMAAWLPDLLESGDARARRRR